LNCCVKLLQKLATKLCANWAQTGRKLGAKKPKRLVLVFLFAMFEVAVAVVAVVAVWFIVRPFVALQN
jgi:hypothetical protein